MPANNPGSEAQYRRLLSAPPDHLRWELAQRVVRLRRIVDDLEQAESSINTRWVVVEICVLLVVSTGLVLLTIIPLVVGIDSFGNSEGSFGFPTSISAIALLLAPISLYALHNVHRAYIRVQHRRQAVDQFTRYATKLIAEAQELSTGLDSEMERQ